MKRESMASFVAAPLPNNAKKSARAPWICSAKVEAAGTTARGANARRLANWIAAEWVNKDQAFESPQFWSHVHVVFRPMPWKFLDGYSFYTESAYDFNLGGPYKTSVVRIINDGNGALELASYKLQNADEYWMGAYETQLLEALTADQLTRMADVCNTVFEWDEGRQLYQARSRPGKGCRITRPGKDEMTYLDSEIVLTETAYSAWDIGRDVETEKRVWGPAMGPFEFVAKNRFVEQVPEEPQETETAPQAEPVASEIEQD